MNKPFSIGVDLGGTNLRVAACSETKNILQTISLRTRLLDGRENVVRDLCGAISSLLATHADNGTCIGIAIGSPGPLELPSGIIRNPPNLPGWENFNLREAIESRLNRCVVIENDANLAALAEQSMGAGKTAESSSLCMLTLGTGVGSGLILNREIWHGSTGMGGEAGHIIVEPDGAPCGCGGIGCLEQYASATAISRMMFESSQRDMTAREVAERALLGDPDALEVFRRVGRALAIALTGLVNTLNLPLHVIGGGASEAWPLFAPSMFRELLLRSYVYRLTAISDDPSTIAECDNSNRTQILRAELGSGAGLLGACLLGLQATQHMHCSENQGAIR